MRRGARAISDGDLVRALAVMPDPYMRLRDAYGAALELGMPIWYGQTIWRLLQLHRWIERTDRPIGNARRQRYWIRRGAGRTVTPA